MPGVIVPGLLYRVTIKVKLHLVRVNLVWFAGVVAEYFGAYLGRDLGITVLFPKFGCYLEAAKRLNLILR